MLPKPYLNGPLFFFFFVPRKEAEDTLETHSVPSCQLQKSIGQRN